MKNIMFYKNIHSLLSKSHEKYAKEAFNYFIAALPYSQGFKVDAR